MKRTHTCGELRKEDVGKKVTLMGWVHRIRDHGGVVFVDLRDRYGMTQIILSQAPNRVSPIGVEYVIAVEGEVRERPEGMKNLNLSTGEIEVTSTQQEILNPSKTPPFVIEDDVKASEDLRLKYRFLDLRREKMKETLILRHRAIQAMRSYLNQKGFLELETPILTRSTPEGARDYLVPSRLYPGKFYCLAQSPQLYKQLLMIAGFDRYYQFARCFRDEDQRRDRQPEHTQIDIEMSFVDEEDVFDLAEGMFHHLFQETKGIDLPIPFPRFTYEEAMSRFGTEKPDLRLGMEIVDVTDIGKESDFKIFRENPGRIRMIQVKEGGKLSRKEIEDMEIVAQNSGAKGLAWMKVEKGKLSGPLAKFFPDSLFQKLEKSVARDSRFGQGTLPVEKKKGSLFLFIADDPRIASLALGKLRVELAKRLNLIPDSTSPAEGVAGESGSAGGFQFCWITHFPLFEWDEEAKQWRASHHIFSMPREPELLEKDPQKVTGKVYDLVCNGEELASGSIRVHQRELQEKVMKVIGLSPEEANLRFGYLLEAFQFGAPPHGGIAPGIDRIVALLAGSSTIRNVIPFPKTTSAQALLEGAPSEVEERQLKELHIQIKKEHKFK